MRLHVLGKFFLSLCTTLGMRFVNNGLIGIMESNYIRKAFWCLLIWSRTWTNHGHWGNTSTIFLGKVCAVILSHNCFFGYLSTSLFSHRVDEDNRKEVMSSMVGGIVGRVSMVSLENYNLKHGYWAGIYDATSQIHDEISSWRTRKQNLYQGSLWWCEAAQLQSRHFYQSACQMLAFS